MTNRCLILAILGVASVNLQAASPQSPATPPNGFSFEGKWTCSGQFGNAKQHRSRYEGSSILGGTWLQLKEVDIEPAGYESLYLISCDKTKNRVIEFDASNFGSAVYMGEGWQNGTLTLTSLPDPDPKAINNRFVFHVLDATRFSVNWEVNGANQWKTSDHLDCNRGARS
jgi:hypothetical protein